MATPTIAMAPPSPAQQEQEQEHAQEQQRPMDATATPPPNNADGGGANATAPPQDSAAPHLARAASAAATATAAAPAQARGTMSREPAVTFFSSDMAEELKEDVVRAARAAQERFTAHKDRAQSISKYLNKARGPGKWHVIVGCASPSREERAF